MFRSERLKAIQSILINQSSADVSVLSEILSVSEVTIRRDLERLEQEGFLIRTHGGALIKESVVAAPGMPPQPKTAHSAGEENDLAALAKMAFSFIDPHSAVFLGSGSICVALAALIAQTGGVTVLTNSLECMRVLSQGTNIKVFSTGGELDMSSLSYLGVLADQNLSTFHVDKAFIEIDGFSLTHGFSVCSLQYSLFLDKLCRISQSRIVLGMGEAFSKPAFARVESIRTPDAIVTTKEMEDIYKQHFFSENIPLYIPFNALGGK